MSRYSDSIKGVQRVNHGARRRRGISSWVVNAFVGYEVSIFDYAARVVYRVCTTQGNAFRPTALKYWHCRVARKLSFCSNVCNKMDDAFTNRLTLAISSTFSFERSQRRKENYPARCFSRDPRRCSTLIIIIIYLCSVISPRCGREITFVFLRKSKYGKRFTVPRSSRLYR